MKYLPYENYTVTSMLPADEILHRLKSNVESKQLIRIPFLNSKTTKLYEGKVLHNEFIISRILGYRNSSKPIIIGQIIQGVENTTICIKARMIYFAYIFMFAWLGGVTFAGLVIIKQQIEAKEFEPSIFLVPVMFLFGYGLMIAGFKYETNKFKKFLVELVK